ncbi:MAG TPA: ABC transporter substrate-binding protein [Candidatus Omnitrophota bacterium]|nr:ABC transporter substrate-binding protein [Candidatus Omnitrophota bacterium]
MGCCDEPYLSHRIGPLGRRDLLKGIAGVTAFVVSRPALGQGAKLKLAFCGQLLCVVPYEVTRERGHFKDEGLDVELVYTRGGNAAMQALVGGAVDYAGTSFDVALQAFARGAPILRFASTGRLPLFALATAPGTAGSITSVKDLEGKVVAVSGLGNADHALVLFLMDKAGANPKTVKFATIGTNLYQALRLGQADAGMVQEPALTLLAQAGGRVLVNAMDIEDARRHLGGPFEFMGVAVRKDERDRRLDEMRRLARALAKGLKDTQTIPVEEIIVALPKELVAGGEQAQLLDILKRYRASLWPDTVAIDKQAVQRVVDAQKAAELIPQSVDATGLLDTTVVPG